VPVPPRAPSTPRRSSPLLARGELQTIGATTLDEYRKHFEKDAALERRFQSVQVHEPSLPHTINILKGLRDKYEAFHKVSITDGAIVSAANLADRYVSDRFLPDKAIDLIDEAGARLRLSILSAPPELREFDERIAGVRAQKEGAIEDQDFEKAASPATRRRSFSASVCVSRSSGVRARPEPAGPSTRASSPRCWPRRPASPSSSSPKKRRRVSSSWRRRSTSASSVRRRPSRPSRRPSAAHVPV
jgi:ATP-dependent Clp protease ATP-binding subunit ClpA